MLRHFSARVLLAGSVIQAGISPALAQMPSRNGVPEAPDGLLLSPGAPWAYVVRGARSPSPLGERQPSDDEQAVIAEANRVFDSSAAKAMALLDGDKVVWSRVKAPADEFSFFNSLSIGKTVTALAVGAAICSGEVSLEMTVAEAIDELANTDLGKSTVKQLLTMSSGTWEGNADSTIFNEEEWRKLPRGGMSYMEVLQRPQVNGAQRTFFSKRLPGEVFAYRSTDPLAVAILVERRIKRPFTEWIEKSVLEQVGNSDTVYLGRDGKSGYAQADSGVKMKFVDWLRFAGWVQMRSRDTDCLGSFIRESREPHIPNTSNRFGRSFASYGYFTWLNNQFAPNSAWAVGHGGQRIGWSLTNDKAMVVFSNAEDWMPELYGIFNLWNVAR